MKYWPILLSSIFVLTACVGDSRTGIGNDPTVVDEPGNGQGTSDDDTGNFQDSVIPSTGGRAVSPDGKFAVVVGPRVFDTTVTMRVEQTEVLDESEELDASAITPRYNVTYHPEGVLPYSDSTFRAEFILEAEQLDAIGADMIALWHLAPLEEVHELSGLNLIDDTFPKLWASVPTLGTFGLVDLSLTDACPCDADSECDIACICDPDCGGTVDPADNTDPTDESDPTDTTDPSEGSDVSDPSTTTSCNADEFACHDGLQCVPQTDFCNGLPQCNDGSDETDPACTGTGGGGCGGGDNTTIGDDEFEPDNSFNEAGTFEPGAVQVHSISPGDEDYILFTLDGPYDVTIETTGLSGDTKLWLYTENHTELAYDDDGADVSLFSRITMPLQAGNYFAKCTGYSATTEIPSYTLTVTATPPLADAPTNLVATLDGQNAILTWDAMEGATAYNVYYGNYPGNYAPSYPAAEGLPPLAAADATMTLTGLQTGQSYYFTVRSVNAEGVESYPAIEANLQIPMETDSYEPNDDFASAHPLVSGETIQLSIHQPTDLDYWTFTLPVLASVHLETDGQTGDGQLYLYNSSMSQIGYNDDGGNGLFSMLDVELQPGVYYVLSQSYYNNYAIASYSLAFTAVYQAPTVDAPDAFEVDDTLEAPSSITGLETQERNFHREEDVDFVTFTLDTVSDVTISTDGVYGGTHLTLFDAEGVEMENVQSGTPAEFVVMERIGMTAGTYTVKIESHDPTILIFYDLLVAVVAYPDPPTNLRCSGLVDEVNLVWDAVPGATAYQIDYQYSDNPPLQILEASEGPSPLETQEISYSLTGLPSDAHTYFRVAAIAGEQVSEYSDIVTCTPQ